MMGNNSLRKAARYAHNCPEGLRPSIAALDICYKSATVGVYEPRIGLEKAGKIKVESRVTSVGSV